MSPLLETPGPVVDLKVLAVTKSSCTIGWKKPRSDGGSRITGYVVDFLTEENKWQRVMKSLSLQYSAKDLKEGKEYTFRVSAENENGEGTPSEIVVMAKDDVGKHLPVQPRLLSPVIRRVSWSPNSLAYQMHTF